MKSILRQLAQAGDISYLSYYFAEFIAEQDGSTMDDLLALTAALVSENNQQGDVCVTLDAYENQPLFKASQSPGQSVQSGVTTLSWRERLLASSCVGCAGDLAPLILEGDRLYLNRFWFYETQVANAILSRLGMPITIDKPLFATSLKKLFPAEQDPTTNRSSDQLSAVALAASHRFSVISGGPGTGKTTTVVKLLSFLLSQQPDMRIRLAAPTGKAAARLVESIRARIFDSQIPESIQHLIPHEATTIHRLLRYGNQRFRYCKNNPLALDCIVVDEASMIDLTLMYHLLDALPEHARIILLGDRDQLASVAAGNVLGDITGHGIDLNYSRSQTEFLKSVNCHIGVEADEVSTKPSTTADIGDTIALLKHSYRFRATSGIGRFSTLVNQGLGQDAIELLAADSKELCWHRDCDEALAMPTLELILDSYQPVVTGSSVIDAMSAFDSVRVLCALRSGPFGIKEINRLIARRMQARGWISGESFDAGESQHFHGQPILITQNDYELGLFNGDTGLVWREPSGKLSAYFRASDDELLKLPLQSLPEHLPAWAMTVHKSQGSEFDRVFLILPTNDSSNTLTRELLYTGATRARQHLYLHATASAIMSGCQKLTQRHSGLAQRLGWDDGL
jgi:exodeoxyribonuclease V alpha subunit